MAEKKKASEPREQTKRAIFLGKASNRVLSVHAQMQSDVYIPC